MNNFARIILCCVLLFIGYACNRKILLLSRTDSDKEIIIRMNKKDEVITAVQFPFYFSIENTSIRKKYFCDVEYKYGFIKKGSGMELYKDNQKITCNGLKYVPANMPINYFAYSRHLIDFSEFTQEQLKPYRDKMMELNQDTLHIGTITEFRAKHSKLLELLTKDDSISILILKNNKSWDGTRIAIPANW